MSDMTEEEIKAMVSRSNESLMSRFGPDAPEPNRDLIAAENEFKKSRINIEIYKALTDHKEDEDGVKIEGILIKLEKTGCLAELTHDAKDKKYYVQFFLSRSPRQTVNFWVDKSDPEHVRIMEKPNDI